MEQRSDKKGSKKEKAQANSSKPQVAQARAYISMDIKKGDMWLRNLCSSEEKPNDEQGRSLRGVVERCKTGRAELHRNSSLELSEPMRACLMGFPGAGKSKCLKWEDGVQFQFLAFQNTIEYKQLPQ